MKKIAIFLVILLVIIIAASAGLIVLSINLNQPPEKMPEHTVFRVNKGDTATIIAENLQKQGLIKNSVFFDLYVRIKGTAGEMKSGLYRIDGGNSTVGIHNLLLKGSEELFKVVIPPGFTSREIAVILEKNGITSAEAFLDEVNKRKAEGFLFPDTYSFPRDYPADKTVAYMIETFEDAVRTVYPEYDSLDPDELRKKIIMASIIEREYRRPDEAARIASVFYNRIEKNMYLGSCATVVYVITEQLGREHPEKLLYRDLEIDSPYNTYINKGLPPGPICNPGLTALDAAFNPEDTDFLYFLLEDPETGKHFFSKSLAEHNRSYELYIKGK